LLFEQNLAKIIVFFLHLSDRPLKVVRGHNLDDQKKLHTSQLICDFFLIHGICRAKASAKLAKNLVFFYLLAPCVSKSMCFSSI
jgi:hypothetical protein